MVSSNESFKYLLTRTEIFVFSRGLAWGGGNSIDDMNSFI